MGNDDHDMYTNTIKNIENSWKR
jgi:hypothetical protein